MTVHDKEETVRERKLVITAIVKAMQDMAGKERPCFGCMATGAMYFAAMIGRRHLNVTKEEFLETVASVWDDLGSPANTLGKLALN